MFRTLIAEMSRHCLTRRKLARRIRVAPNTLTKKLNDHADFTEIYNIRDVLAKF